MRLLLCGGGSGKQTTKAYSKFNEIIDHSKPLLYIPLALDYKKYEECLEWIKRELKDVDVPYIEMIYSANDILSKNLEDYCAIFIGGGNTFKLLSELKECNAFEHIKKFINSNGIIFGGSAGAIILGYDINSCLYSDNNNIALLDTKGFNCLFGNSVVAHYTNKNESQTQIATDYLTKYSIDSESVIALPEEVTLFINNDGIEFIGNNVSYYFYNGKRKVIDYYLNNQKYVEEK